ncbi:uncharacterized protein LOC109791764 [Cajanus cajan]|uniref:uncharacterized protein LOC109791764 n=1 Tax=Cajanus cajan TaxID=3821 RepID=UPI00098D8B6D|nr:uncharacterized protein LOC109791764 [Cajanus cajan]
MEASKKKGIAIKKKTIDHWAFLEHIEAPMWVDLILEAKSGGVDTGDDDWFNTSHPFHQMSARELKSKFSQTGEEMLTSGVDLQGVNSPELPSSVSRSRGKHYNSKKWEGVDLNNLLDKQKGMSRRGFQQGSGFGLEVKPKSKLDVNRPKGLLSGKSGLVFERNARGKTEFMASCSNSVSSSSDQKTSRSTTRSTITSDITQKYREVSSQPCDQKISSLVMRVTRGKSCVTRKVSGIQPQKKCLEVSSQPCDQKSRSSSIISTRRSYILGKASNVEIDSDGMQSRGRKSSTGKSSVGSCSNPGYEVKFVSRQQREKITDEKGEVAMNLAVNNRSKPGEISKTSAKFGNRKESNITFGKPAYHRTAKSLVQYPSTSSKALLQHTVNKENICTGGAKEKLRNSKVNSLTSKGKEITTRNVTANQKCISRGVSQKGDTTGSTALTKVGRCTYQRDTKNPINPARRIYAR